MTAQDFIFKTAPFKKIEGEEYKELYKELSNDNLSVSGYNPIYNVETTYHLESCPINVGPGPMGQNEIDMIAEDELADSVTFYEIKRQKDEISLGVLRQKAEVFLQATHEFRGYDISYKGLSMEDM